MKKSKWEFKDEDWDLEEEYEKTETFNGIKQIVRWVKNNNINNLDYEIIRITGFKQTCVLYVTDDYVRVRIDVDHSNPKEQRKWKKLQMDCLTIEDYQAEVDLT